jgi:putative ABC transport system substrate-binding protein
MKRRDFIGLASAFGATAALPRVAFGQRATKVPHVALLFRADNGGVAQHDLEQGLADLGLVNGSNVIIDAFTPPTDADLPAYAARAVGSQPDVIVSGASAPSLAVKAITTTIPIVFVNAGDPIGAGLVPSLAHPGGNLTGTTNLGADLIGKQLAVLKELVPSVGRFALPFFPADPITPYFIPQVQSAAMRLYIEPVPVELTQGQDYSPQFNRVIATGAQAAFHPPYGEFNAIYDLMFDLYVKNKMPVLSGNPVRRAETTPVYGLIHYASDSPAMTRQRVAAMVQAILNGAKPGDIPVEQPTTFNITVNLDMARKIGISIPPSILAQATQVIDYDIRAPKAAY